MNEIEFVRLMGYIGFACTVVAMVALCVIASRLGRVADELRGLQKQMYQIHLTTRRYVSRVADSKPSPIVSSPPTSVGPLVSNRQQPNLK